MNNRKVIFTIFSMLLFLTACQTNATNNSGALSSNNSGFVFVDGNNSVNSENRSIPNNDIGNSIGNILNVGYIAAQGDYIYYSSQHDNSPTLQMTNINSSDSVILDDCRAYSINVIGEFVFYVNSNDGYKLCSINTKTKEKKVLTNFKVSEVYVDSNYIYCLDKSYNRIVRMNLSGDNQKNIIDFSSVSNMELVLFSKYKDKLIYQTYCVDSDHMDLVKKSDKLIVDDLDGIELKSISDIPLKNYYYFLENDMLYYTGKSSELCSYNLKSGERLTLLNDTVLSMNYYNNKIYYVNYSSNNNIYCYDTLDKSNTRLLDVNSIALNIINDNIYFLMPETKDSTNYKMFRTSLKNPENYAEIK